MSTIVGKGIISAGGGGELNVFVQETQPTAQNGLWVKRAKDAVTGVEIDNQVKAADGNNLTLPGNWGEQGQTDFNNAPVFGIVHEGIIHVITAASSYNSNSLVYDIETGIFSLDTSGYASSNIASFFNCVVGTLGYYVQNDGDRQLFCIDPVNKIKRRVCYYSNTISGSPSAILVEDGIEYLTMHHSTSTITLHRTQIPETESKVSDVQLATWNINQSLSMGKIVHYGGLIYVLEGTRVIGAYDPSTGTSTSILELVAPSYLTLQPTMGHMVVGSMVLFIGVDNKVQKSSGVSVYDLETRTHTYKENVLTDEFTRDSVGTPCLAFDGYTVYRIGGKSGNLDMKTIIKYTATSNDLPTGTVWAHESTSKNVTEMYKDKTMKLNLGIDKVLIQEADGLKVQPTAIIKNGVATDIN